MSRQLNSSEREICGAIDLDASKISQNVQMLASFLSNKAFVDQNIQFVRNHATHILTLSDDKIAELLMFSNTEPNGLDPKRKKEVIDEIRKTLAELKTSFGYKDFKTFIALIASGMQFAYDEFGRNTIPQHILMDVGKVGCMGYLLPNGTTASDIIIIEPGSILSHFVKTKVHKYSLNPAFTPEEELVEGGFQEAYHCWQVKTDVKREELIEQYDGLYPDVPKNFVGMRRPVPQKLPIFMIYSEQQEYHERDPMEKDFEVIKAPRLNKIKEIAKDVTTRCSQR